jgi:hypothetical protein
VALPALPIFGLRETLSVLNHPQVMDVVLAALAVPEPHHTEPPRFRALALDEPVGIFEAGIRFLRKTEAAALI